MTVVVMNNMKTIGLTLYISALPVTDRIKTLKDAAEDGSFSFFLLLVSLTRSDMQYLQSCPHTLFQLSRKCVMYL